MSLLFLYFQIVWYGGHRRVGGTEVVAVVAAVAADDVAVAVGLADWACRGRSLDG